VVHEVDAGDAVPLLRNDGNRRQAKTARQIARIAAVIALRSNYVDQWTR